MISKEIKNYHANQNLIFVQSRNNKIQGQKTKTILNRQQYFRFISNFAQQI